MKNNGRVERRRDWFRPMASSVSALSSIVANGLQILPSFPPPPLLTSRNALTGTRANSTRLRIGWTRTLFQLRTIINLLRMQRPHPRSKGPNERPPVAAGTALCLHVECQRPSTTEADPAAAGRPPMSLRKPAAWQRLWLIPPPLGRGWGRLWGSSLEAPKLKELVQLPLHGAWDQVEERLMKGKVSSGAGVCWPIIPKWGDRQVCLITCSAESV